ERAHLSAIRFENVDNGELVLRLRTHELYQAIKHGSNFPTAIRSSIKREDGRGNYRWEERNDENSAALESVWWFATIVMLSLSEICCVNCVRSSASISRHRTLNRRCSNSLIH